MDLGIMYIIFASTKQANKAELFVHKSESDSNILILWSTPDVDQLC